MSQKYSPKKLPPEMNAERTHGWHERHHHLLLGGARERLEELFQVQLQDFRTWFPPKETADSTSGIGRLNSWLRSVLVPAIHEFDWPSICAQAALEQAVKDGVTRLEASFNLGPNSVGFLEKLPELHARYAPKLNLKIDLGIVRSISAESQLEWLKEVLSAAEKGPAWTYLLGGIDLYDVEDAAVPETFLEHFRTARGADLKLKAHVGEFGSPETIRHTVQTLELDEVQHGIQACVSPEVLKFLADRGTILNLAPASNRILASIDFTQNPHPIRTIWEAGVRFTISTDDFLLFGASIADQLKELAEIFSPNELEKICESCRASNDGN